MIDDICVNLVNLKKEFECNYKKKNKFHEVIPLYKSELFPIKQSHLDLLYNFVVKNPLYYNSFETKINSVDCVVYEGKLRQYTHKHSESLQPFYPTWLMSAYLSVLIAKELGYEELVDIGSGDGRISFCGNLLGLKSYSIELDESLVELQKQYNIDAYCSNAILFDYSSLNLSHPVFFIGGLADLGADKMSLGVLEQINMTSGWVFPGIRKYRTPQIDGWSKFIEENNLKYIHTVSLPTGWTNFEEGYIFTNLEK